MSVAVAASGVNVDVGVTGADVKVGVGAFMPDLASARELSDAMIELGRRAGLPTTCMLTRMDEPLGFRDAYAGVRTDELRLAQALLILKDQEEKVVRNLELQYRQLSETVARIRSGRAQREAYAEELELRLKEFNAGRNVPLHVLLESQRSWADALSEETRAVVDYNTALAGFEYAKGTILDYDKVSINEGPLPRCGGIWRGGGR